MTNILLLPKFDSSTSFAIARNGDWLDAIFFSAPGSPTAPIVMTGSIVEGVSVVTVESSKGLIPGLPIVAVPGIPPGTYVGTMPTATTFGLVDVTLGVPVPATITDAETSLTFEPLPLDLTGIEFVAEIRRKAGGTDRYLIARTDDQTIINGGASGVLAFNVTRDLLKNLLPGSYVLDILAIADGRTINLFPEGPASIDVATGVTVPAS